MYIIYCIFASLIEAFIYEYSGLSGIAISNVLLSFLLFLMINLIISRISGRYKRTIVIFSLIPVILSIGNTAKVRFQLTEISFFDLKIIRAAGDMAGLFLDKLPYVQIISIILSFIIFIIISKKYVSIFDKIKDRYDLNKKFEIENILHSLDNIFHKKYFKLFPIILLSFFFVFTSTVSLTFSTSSFGNLLISAKTLTQLYMRRFEDKEDTIRRIIKTAEKDDLSNVDEEDGLLKGYPFNKQSNIDIIIVQSETFFDLPKYQDKLGKNGIIIQEDIHTNFHNYQKNGISGTLYVPTVGGGTVNTEYEVLTGYGAKYFATGTIVFTAILENQMNSIAYFLKEYVGNTKSIAIHNHDADFWERDRVYPLLGIDKFIDITMFTEEEQSDLVGVWMSDKTIFDMTIRQLEENKDTNNFILPVTVQNHGPFLDKRGEYVEVENLSINDNWEISNYITNLKHSDEELKKFMDYIDARQKPTMVIFYGDHKPDSNYDIFKNSSYYNENYRRNLFNTDYFIYFNNAVQDEKLRSLIGTQADISAPAMNRYIQILLGDTSSISMYMYNYSKNPENYFDKDVISGVKDSIFRDISINFINSVVEYDNKSLHLWWKK